MANFTINKIRRITQYANAAVPAAENHGVAVEKDDILWTIKDVTDFSISNGSEMADAVDGDGVVIESYLRSKTAEMSGSNALFDLPLAAAQAGTKLTTGAVEVQFHDILKLEKAAKEVTLTKTPKAGGEPKVVYVMNNDGSLGEKLVVGAEGGATYAEGKITFTTSPAAADAVQLFIPYIYEEADAQKFTNFADANTIPGRCVVEGLGKDVCTHELVYFYITAPYAQLAIDGDLNFATDGTHDFTINCKKEYCGEEGLYSVIVC